MFKIQNLKRIGWWFAYNLIYIRSQLLIFRSPGMVLVSGENKCTWSCHLNCIIRTSLHRIACMCTSEDYSKVLWQQTTSTHIRNGIMSSTFMCLKGEWKTIFIAKISLLAHYICLRPFKIIIHSCDNIQEDK